MAYRKDWGQPQAGQQGFARTMKIFGRNININATEFAVLGNIVGAFMVPAGFTLVGFVPTTVPALGTGATLTLSIGDALSNNRLLNASTIGQAGGAMPALASTGFLYRYPTDTEIQIAVAAAATAGIAAPWPLFLQGFIN